MKTVQLLTAAALVVGAALNLRGQQRPPAFKLLRDQESYAYLGADTLYAQRTAWERLKFMPLGARRTFHLSVGGEIRQQFEYFNNTNWGEGPEDRNGYLLQRYQLHTDWQLGTYVRVFAQLKSGLVYGKAGGPEPPDEDRLDLHQAFADLRLPTGPQSSDLTVRVGRQELSYGSSRLVSVREGPNVRQSFDALKVVHRAPGRQIDAFVSRPVQTNRRAFDDGSDPDRVFWGAYSVQRLPSLPGASVDLYYLGLRDRAARFQEGEALERRHSLGLRLWNQESSFTYNVEGVYQFGSFGPGAVRAYTLSANVVRTWEQLRGQPRLELRTEVISGDRRPSDGQLQTFNPLFPKGSYFGQVALVGPANLVDLHPLVAIQPASEVSVSFDADLFWRHSRRDGLYAVPYVPIRAAGASRARHIGNQYTLTGSWEPTAFWSCELFVTYFTAGRFLRETGAGRNLTFVAPRLTLRF